MNLYIKSFNRPFYLERCLLTIQAFVGKNCKITVLDDGTPARYLKKISSRFPEVCIVQSPHGEMKAQRMAEGSFVESLSDEKQRKLGLINSAEFWCHEIRKCQEPYVCVLEEDVWF